MSHGQFLAEAGRFINKQKCGGAFERSAALLKFPRGHGPRL